MLTVETTAEGEEAVAALMERLFVQPVSVYVDEETQVRTLQLFFPEKSSLTDQRRVALAAGLRQIEACGLNVGSARVAFRKLAPENWAESWKRHFRPLQFGRALLIRPSWSRRQPRGKQALVVIDPGLSFGTGQHPTTSFCLSQLVKRRRPGRAQSFWDVGSGSGILAIAAAKLGYRPVEGLDSDRDAVRIARANARQNGLQGRVRFVHQDLSRLPVTGPRTYDVICANLILDLLRAERERLLNRLGADGTLILAGLLRSQFPLIRAAYETAGLKLVSHHVGKEWESGAFVFRNVKKIPSHRHCRWR